VEAPGIVEDYDMKVARELVQGVDLWLNTPRRGEEACGTSGMKAGINGVLNLSVLDGWFDEAYENSGGWAIGEREPYHEEQDGIHSSAVYYQLENEIVPMFYERRETTTSNEWMRRVKHSADLSQSAIRLPAYGDRVYDAALPAGARRLHGLAQRNFENARERERSGARAS